MFDDATLEEVDIDLLIHGVTLPEPNKFRPLSLFCRKPAGLQLGVHVGRKSGLRPVRLTYTGEGLIRSDNFIEQTLWVMATASLEQFLICFWDRR